jgi:hypothetical protein
LQLEVLQLSTPDTVCLVDCAMLSQRDLSQFVTDALEVAAGFRGASGLP